LGGHPVIRQKHYGWHADLPDHRDRIFSAPPRLALPPMVNLHPLVTTIYDQGQLGSCTANAIGQAIMLGLSIEKAKAIVPSRLFIYFNERVIEGTVSADAGASLRDGLKAVAQQGACPESEWPYNVARFAVKPSAKCYTDGRAHEVQRYLSVTQSAQQIQSCLAAGFPFVFGFSVYDSFESDQVAKTGNVPIPQSSEAMLGGHAVAAIGYNLGPDIVYLDGIKWPSRTVLCQNSWGANWGMKQGCFTIPMEYLTDPNLASDFWTIRSIETVAAL
jgi:C1A family cysteine protease